jgi:hypothetical protein
MQPYATAGMAWSAVRVTPQFGQVSHAAPALAEQAGQLLDMNCSLVGALPWGPIETRRR